MPSSIALIAFDVLAACGLLGTATYYWRRGMRPPPLAIRSESGRSPEEYAFRRQARGFKEIGNFCLAGGLAGLIIFAALAATSFGH